MHYIPLSCTSSPCNLLFLNLGVYGLVQATVGVGTVLIRYYCGLVDLREWREVSWRRQLPGAATSEGVVPNPPFPPQKRPDVCQSPSEPMERDPPDAVWLWGLLATSYPRNAGASAQSCCSSPPVIVPHRDHAAAGCKQSVRTSVVGLHRLGIVFYGLVGHCV